MIVGIVTRSVRILFSHSTESRPAEGASNDDRSSVRAGLPRAIASATSRLRPPTCRTRAVPRFPPPSDALLSPVGIPRVTEGGRDRVEVPGPEIRQTRVQRRCSARRSSRAPSDPRFSGRSCAQAKCSLPQRSVAAATRAIPTVRRRRSPATAFLPVGAANTSVARSRSARQCSGGEGEG